MTIKNYSICAMKEYAGYFPFLLRCEDYMKGVKLVRLSSLLND